MYKFRVIIAVFWILPCLYFAQGVTKISGTNKTFAVATSAANGNWTAGGTWGGSVPAGGDNITVNHAVVVNTNIAITGTLTVNSSGSLIDPVGGTNYTLDVAISGQLNIHGKTKFGGAAIFQNNSVIHVYCCDTFTIGALDIKNNAIVIIDVGATLIVNGNLTLENNNAITLNGTIRVKGNVVALNNATSTGLGVLTATGTITTQNGSDIMGFTGDCSVAPCIAASGLFGTLPIELLGFYAQPKGNVIDLDWSTASELNNKFFTVERSSDGFAFEPLIEINSLAPNGNCNSLLNYSATDNSPIDGLAYYRLKQTDFDGKSTYSDIISVNFYPPLVKFVIYPNPNKGEFAVDFSGIENNRQLEIFIYNGDGQQVYKKDYYTQETSGTINITPEQKLERGIYNCLFVVGGIKYFSKIIVN